MHSNYYLGIDIGGTTIKYGVIADNGSIINAQQLETQADGGLDIFQKKLMLIFEQTVLKYTITAIGISVAGIVNTESNKIIGGLNNLDFLTDFDLVSWYSLNTGLNVKLINDIQAAALGELWNGAARNIDNFFCVSIGTGIGGCIVINRKIFSGANHRAGEFGYIEHEKAGRYLEELISSKALLAMARNNLGYPYNGLVKFFELVQEGDKAYSEVFYKWVDDVGKSLSIIVLLLDPQAIIIGGGITEVGDLLLYGIKNSLKQHLPINFYNQIKVFLADNKNYAGMLGAVKNVLS